MRLVPRSFGSLPGWGVAAFLVGTSGCGDPAIKDVAVVRVQPEAAPECGAPADARTMILRALGEFPASEATAQSVELGAEGTFSIDRFPESTTMLEAEVRGFGGALRVIGRSQAFALEALGNSASIPIFLAPFEGVCPTGPASVSRTSPQLAHVGDAILVLGGSGFDGTPSAEVELYHPTEGRFEALEGRTYADTTALGLLGASVTTLSGGDVAIIGGAATAYQIFGRNSEQFAAPAFYREARGRHAALALDDGRVFVAAGCSQITPGGCDPGTELLTTSILDTFDGQIEDGPSLQIPRIGGRAWLERPGQVLLIGGTDTEGDAVTEAERVFLDGRPSERIANIGGASAQGISGAVWAGLSSTSNVSAGELGAVRPDATEASTGFQAAFAESDSTLVALEDGNLLAMGATGIQKIRTLDGVSSNLGLPEFAGQSGQSAIALADGTVLVTAGQRLDGSPVPSYVFRPSLLGPQSASSTTSFSSLDLSEGLSASDPSAIQIIGDEGPHLLLETDEGETEFVLLAGPRPKEASLQASMGTAPGGSAVFYFAWQSLYDHFEIVVEPNVPPILYRVTPTGRLSVGGSGPDRCSGVNVPEADLVESEGAHEMELKIRGGEIVLRVEGNDVLTCTLESAPAAGFMGIGGSGVTGTSLRIDLISLSR